MPESIAVIIPTRFSQPKITEALQSVFDQSLCPAEIIVVQDGPALDLQIKAKAVELIRNSRLRSQCSIKELAQPAGAPTARNIGAGICSSKYIAFLDDDDCWFSEKLSKQLDVLKKQPNVAVVSCDYEMVKQGATRKVRYSSNNQIGNSKLLLLSNLLGSCSFCMLRKGQFDTCGGFDQSLPSAQDWDLWLRVCTAFGDFYIISEVLARYSDERNPNRISTSAKRRVVGYLYFLRKHRHLIPVSLWPFHLLRMLQFALNDFDRVKKLSASYGPKVRKIVKKISGFYYSKEH